MKTWSNPELINLDIAETAQHCFGTSWDGGYIGDGHAGLLGEKCTADNPCILHMGNGSGSGSGNGSNPENSHS